MGRHHMDIPGVLSCQTPYHMVQEPPKLVTLEKTLGVGLCSGMELK